MPLDTHPRTAHILKPLKKAKKAWVDKTGLTDLPEQVSISLACIALIALAWKPYATIIYLLLFLIMFELHRELFHPGLNLRHYFRTLSIDYAGQVEIFKKKENELLFILIPTFIFIFWAPGVVVGIFGGLALLIILYHWLLRDSAICDLASHGLQMLDTAVAKLRPLLGNRRFALLLGTAGAYLSAWLFTHLWMHLWEVDPDSVIKLHAYLTWIFSILSGITLIALLAAPRLSLRDHPDHGDGPENNIILLLANVSGLLTTLVTGIFLCMGLNISFPFEKPLLNGSLLGLLFSFIFWRRAAKQTRAMEDASSRRFAAWSALIPPITGALIWWAMIEEGTELWNPGWRFMLTTVIWFLLAASLIRLVKPAESVGAPLWAQLHLAAMANFLIVYVSGAFGGRGGLVLSLAAITLILSNIWRPPKDAAHFG